MVTQYLLRQNQSSCTSCRIVHRIHYGSNIICPNSWLISERVPRQVHKQPTGLMLSPRAHLRVASPAATPRGFQEPPLEVYWTALLRASSPEVQEARASTTFLTSAPPNPRRTRNAVNLRFRTGSGNPDSC